MPKIHAATVADHRSQQRADLLDAARELLRDLGDDAPLMTARLLQGFVNAATTALEAGDDYDAVKRRAVQLAVAATGGLRPVTGAAESRRFRRVRPARVGPNRPLRELDGVGRALPIVANGQHS